MQAMPPRGPQVKYEPENAEPSRAEYYGGWTGTVNDWIETLTDEKSDSRASRYSFTSFSSFLHLSFHVSP